MLKEKDFNSIPLLLVNSWEQYVEFYKTSRLATNMHGIIVPLSGHRIPEERPEFVVKHLVNFFGDANTKSVLPNS